MTAPSYYTPALVYARAALARGPLTEHRIMDGGRGVFWRCGRRLFSAKTVRTLIANGEAQRIGKTVERATNRETMK